MRKIRFRFDQEKLVAALTLFASRGVPDLDVMKSLKLLYFADKAHLLKYGRPILGDDYYGMAHGPVPSNSYNIIKDVLGQKTPSADVIDAYLGVDMASSHPTFVAKQPPDMDAFSASDVEILEETIQKYGDKDALELRRLAHQEPEIQRADEQLAAERKLRVDLPYDMFFGPGDERIRAVVSEDQENQDFAQALTW